MRFPRDVPSSVLSSLCPGASQAEEREQSTGGYHRVNLVIARLSRHDLDKGSLSCYTVVNPGPGVMQVAELRHSSQGSHGHRGPEGTALRGVGGMLSPQLHVSSTEVTPRKHDTFCGQVPSRRGMKVHKSLRDLAQNRGRKFPKIHPGPP